MRIIKYFFVGRIAALIDIGIFYVFAQLFHFPWMPVSICSFILATYVNYLLSIKIVFVSDPHKKYKELIGVFFVSGLALIVNQLILYMAIESPHLPLLISKIIATSTVFYGTTLEEVFLFLISMIPPKQIITSIFLMFIRLCINPCQ